MEFRNCFTMIAALAIFMSSAAIAQPDTLWTQTYGGSGSDRGRSVQQTQDGGYIIAGETDSYGAGDNDFYLIKTDASGTEEWQQTYGGIGTDQGFSVQQTSDGGYIIVGYTASYGAGGWDVYLVKTDASGDSLWTRTYGGSDYDCAESVQQTADGGYVIAGYTMSYGAGGSDVYLIKTDASGDTLWTRTFGGSGWDMSHSVQQTDDGGYIVVGALGSDVWLIKTDASGDSLWTQTYGGSSDEYGYCVQQTQDGGYIIAGMTHSYGASYDVYLIKTDESGNELWYQTFGGDGYDFGRSVQQTQDGGYIVAGYLAVAAPDYDVYLVKTNASGDTLWTQTYGGSVVDVGYSVQQTTDGGYIIAGCTDSYGAGGNDVYLIRLGTPEVTVTLTPHNPPIQIPAGGGSFLYDLDIENTTAEAIVADAWIDITPPGAPVMPLIVRLGVVFPASTIITRPDLTQNVPSRAPAGIYVYACSVGEVMGAIIDFDQFTFEKLATGEGLSPVNDWNLSGWEDEVVQVSAPAEFSLSSVYPNPFNPLTTISYALPEAARVSLAVYDLSGRLVASLVDGWRDAGTHEVCFDATNLASGVYVYRLDAGAFTASGKMVLLK